jgi:hypothetical protein
MRSADAVRELPPLLGGPMRRAGANSSACCRLYRMRVITTQRAARSCGLFAAYAAARRYAPEQAAAWRGHRGCDYIAASSTASRRYM